MSSAQRRWVKIWSELTGNRKTRAELETTCGRESGLTDLLYVSNFGEFKLMPSRIVRDQNILVLDMSMWKCAFLIPFTSWELAKTGASMRRQLYVAATLESSNQAASGKVTDINPAL